MCDIATATLAVTAIAGGVSAYGQYQQGQAQEEQYEYQAAVDRNNSIIAQRQADDAIERGRIEEQEHREKVNQIKSSQRVSFASRGIDLGSADVSETLADTAMLGELDALTIRNNAQREAYGYRVQASNFEASAGLKEVAGDNAASSGITSATTTLLGTAATVGSKYSDFQSKGAFSSSTSLTKIPSRKIAGANYLV